MRHLVRGSRMTPPAYGVRHGRHSVEFYQCKDSELTTASGVVHCSITSAPNRLSSSVVALSVHVFVLVCGHGGYRQNATKLIFPAILDQSHIKTTGGGEHWCTQMRGKLGGSTPIESSEFLELCFLKLCCPCSAPVLIKS